MRLHSLVCLLFVFVVVMDSVTSYPAADPDDKDFRAPARKHHGKLLKRQRSSRRHPSRGLKEAGDYGLSEQSTVVATNAEPKSPGDAKYRKIPAVKQDRRRTKKRQAKSKRRKNKRSKKNGNKGAERRSAASLRTARRADPDGPLYDAAIDDEATPKQQLLGLGVFGDMRKFFAELRTNLDTNAAPAGSAIAESGRVKAQDSTVSSDNDPGFEEYEELPNYQALRTMGSEGYGAGLTAPDREHQQRRQSRLRGFVSMAGAGWPSEPSRHHRARQYDPALLWTGLGR